MAVELSIACGAYKVTDVNCIKTHPVTLYSEHRNHLMHKTVTSQSTGSTETQTDWILSNRNIYQNDVCLLTCLFRMC